MEVMKTFVPSVFKASGGGAEPQLGTACANRTAFTLAEMMVVLLIVSIVLAAMAPVMTTKMKREMDDNSGSSASIWKWIDDETTPAIYFSTTGNEPVMVGQKVLSAGEPNALLILNADNANRNHILFKTRDAVLGQLQLDSDKKIFLGSLSEDASAGKGSVAIGSSVNSGGKNSIVIGSGANNVNAINSIVIGKGASIAKEKEVSDYYVDKDSVNTGAIAIGNKATVASVYDEQYDGANPSQGAIAIGREAYAEQQLIYGGGWHGSYTDNEALSSIAIGTKAKATGGSIAIGSEYYWDYIGANDYDTTIADLHSVAIGTGAKAKNKFSVAIGYNADATQNYQITLGTDFNTVYIPGNLVVDGDVVLARGKLGSNNEVIGKPSIYMRENTTKSNGTKVQRMVRVAGTAATFETEDNQSEIINIKENSTRGMLFETVEDANLEVGGFKISDKRLKYVGKESKDGLDKIRQLKVFNYTFKKDPSKEPRVGVIAQDLQNVFPNAVKKASDGFLTIRMEDMFYAVVNAVKELDMKVTELLKQVQNDKREIQALKKENKELKARIEKLEAKVSY